MGNSESWSSTRAQVRPHRHGQLRLNHMWQNFMSYQEPTHTTGGAHQTSNTTQFRARVFL